MPRVNCAQYSLPGTSLAEPDLFAQTAAGRSWFRVDDLLRLCAQIAELEGRKKR
jgi:hypothetical protein